MPYVDSNIFIYPVIYDEDIPKAKRAKEVLLRIARGELKAYTATLTWDEVAWVTRRLLGREDAAKQGRKLLAFPNLVFLGVDEEAVIRAQRFVEMYDLKPRDAIHVGVALTAGQRQLISDDPDFDKVREIRRMPL